uniref:Sosondowah ankyrin repeat domain family member C n=1 Tax=Varanus komodoensis TaxID=61221 RepID=A0A8D2JKF9_VARKO
MEGIKTGARSPLAPMAAPLELTQEAVLRFLAERGGRARNADLLEHFRGFLNSPDPQRRARSRERFKEMVNAVATVRQEPGSGAKYVQLRKKYRGGAGSSSPGAHAGEAAAAGEAAVPQPGQESPGGEGGEGGTAEAEEKLRGDSGEGQPGERSPPPASTASSATLGGVPITNTPRCGRKNFRERVLGSSPQMKHGGLPSRVGSGGSRGGGGGGDSDSASLASSSAEDESGSAGGGSVALDPLEHAWMLCASDGRWESLEGLLSCEPALLSKRDFITGFTCLHWAAKHGRHELLALLVNFAHRHRLPVNINARTSSGYTALHLAAVHGHLEVVKLLVGAYDADVDIRDYSGRKASHYLGQGTAEEVRSLVGALQVEADSAAPNGSGRWRLSKVLPSNLITYKLSHLHHGDEGESGEGVGAPGKGRELSRKISGSGRIKPRLNKIRFRTQIIHTTPSFRGDTEEEGQEEKSLKASFKLRPKSNVFG